MVLYKLVGYNVVLLARPREPTKDNHAGVFGSVDREFHDPRGQLQRSRVNRPLTGNVIVRVAKAEVSSNG